MVWRKNDGGFGKSLRLYSLGDYILLVLKSTSAGQIYGCKSFEEATEIYIYGLSGDAIIASLEEFRKTYPLCQNSAVRKLSAASL